MVAGALRRPPQGKPTERNPDTFRRIFSAHKKVRHGVALNTRRQRRRRVAEKLDEAARRVH